MGDYDNILKLIAERLQGAIISHLFNIKDLTGYRTVSFELPEIHAKHVDTLAEIINDNKSKTIIHMEYQTSNHTKMEYRMCEYLIHIKLKYPEHNVIQAVLYLGKDENKMSDNLLIESNHTKLNYKYELINLKELSSEAFLQSDVPELVILAVLTKHEPEEDLVHSVIEKLKSLSKDNIFEEHLSMVDVLITLRPTLEVSYLEELNKMGLEIDLKKTVGYRFGEKDGLQKGRVQGQLLALIESVIIHGEDLVESKLLDINQWQVLKEELQSESITIDRVKEIRDQLRIVFKTRKTI
jgi:hypothetical protein